MKIYWYVMALCMGLWISILIPLESTATSNKQYPSETLNKPPLEKEEESIILEVSKEPKKAKKSIESQYPSVQIIMVYDALFQGLALKGPPDKIKKIGRLDFVQAIHPARTYRVDTRSSIQQRKHHEKESVIPSDWNDTGYTGKGVKVAIIDTGIDYEHPDLQDNYKGGYDVVDLDADPMETKANQGIPTLHGTHVAGIIGANGKLKGIAPDADLYAYRALGPGGVGSSIQIIAALEQAVKDGADIINLSLGNAVNGPDYPTSIAVNKAVELGSAVIIANGNSGPKRWTVGAPATASKAISVGAYHPDMKKAFLYHWKDRLTIPLEKMPGSIPWQLDKDYPVARYPERDYLYGKIALITPGNASFSQLIQEAEAKGAVAAIISNEDEAIFQGLLPGDRPITIPLAVISKEDGQQLKQKEKDGAYYVQTTYQTKAAGITDFSSRGPVTVNWDIKPNIVAPGKHILSTIPAGYEHFDGTSMAAPFISGIFAVMKEAYPNWTNEEVLRRLQTTAKQLTSESDSPYPPSHQGMGLVQLAEALDTTTIIADPFLTFGRARGYTYNRSHSICIENKSDKEQTYTFSLPDKQVGIHWDLPRSTTIKKQSKECLTIGLDVNTMLAKKGLHEGWLELQSGEQTYQLPYTFINKKAANPKLMGFEFSLKPFSEDSYVYRLYATEAIDRVDVHLYDRDTLLYHQPLLSLDKVQIGMNEGHLSKDKVKAPGLYRALLTIQLQDGRIESEETEVYIE